MKLILKEVIIDRFLSFNHVEILLSDRGYTLIQGINNNPEDNTNSNGSGKSSISEAISWALTGDTIRGASKSVANIYLNEGCKVELLFNVDGKEYRIIRSKDDKELGSNLKIFVDGEDKSGKGVRDSEKLLLEYLPDLTSSLLGSVILLGQGLPQRFTNNTPSGRKEVLENLSGSDYMIAHIKSKLADRKSALDILIRNKEDEHLSNKAKLEINTKNKLEYESQLEKLNQPNDYENLIKDAEEDITELASELYTIEETLDRDEDILNNLRKDERELVAEETKEVKSIEDHYKDLCSEDSSTILLLKPTCDLLEKEITRLESIKDVCPTCGQKLPNVEKIDTKDKREELSSNRNLIKELSNKIKILEDERNNKISEVHKKYSKDSEELISHIKELEEKIKDLKIKHKEKYNLYNEKLRARDRYEDELSHLEENRKTLENKIKEISSLLEEISNSLLYIEDDRDKLKARLDVVNKMTTIATRDFRGYLLSNVISFIDKRAKEYCEDVFNTNKLNFALNGNNIDISYSGKLYENLSGGEKQKIDIIIQLALRDMLCQFSSFSCNCIFLDELFDNIDSLGSEKILNLISTRLKDVESVFIITHHNSIELPVDSTITIIKNDRGISEVR